MFIYILGVVSGLAIFAVINQFINHKRTFGTLVVNSNDVDKDVFTMHIDNLSAVSNKSKKIVLKIVRE